MGAEEDPTSESASVQTNETVTLALFHPKEFAPGDFEPLMTGGVRSTLTLLSVTLAGLPALSTHVPVADWPPPSPRVVGGETVDTPDRASEQAKLTLTGTLFHPFALGWTDLELVMLGGVMSMLMLFSAVLAEFPALSRQVPVTVWPAPSPRVVGGVTLNTPDKVSEQAKLTVTVTLFQPLRFGPTDLELVITGSVLSMFIPVTDAEAMLPALSAQVVFLD